MVRHPSRTAARRLCALAAALMLAACGIKGPLVPAKSAGPDARPPPEATTPPVIPSATLPSNPQPAP